jgi:multidrug efflux pump subunit AcrA (membrane-fusion protein)
MQVEAAEMTLAQAEENLSEVAEDVALKELQLTLNQSKLEDAKKALSDAQEELDEANSKSPIIVALFDGFITMVNVEGGDEVLTGTVAVQLADPNKFEADILVSEMDILQVNLGGEAWVEADAMLGIKLPAEITHISPTAIIQSGVVNYLVKVEIESPQAVMQKQMAERQKVMEEISSEKLPEHLRQAIQSGQITEEQAEDMIKQMQQGQRSPEGQIPTIIPEDFRLKEGLTVTVNILIEERTNVLLVPGNAIERRVMATYVQVMKDGIIEERAINTGISNWQYTEVTDGLSEGEQVVVSKKTTTTTSEMSQPRGPMPFIRPH